MKSLYGYVIFLFFLCSSCGKSNKEKIAEIDRLLDKAEFHYKKYEDLEVLKYSRQAYDLAVEEGTNEQISRSAYSISTILVSLQSYEEALRYIKIAHENCPKDNFFLLGNIVSFEAVIYMDLGFHQEALKKNHFAISQYKKVNITESAKSISFVYQNIATTYYEKKEQDSFMKYTGKAESILLSLPEKEVYQSWTGLYFHKSQSLLKSGKADSALYYTNQSIALKNKYKDPMLFLEYTSLGDYFYEKQNKEKSLEYYLKAIENVKKDKEFESQDDMINIYEAISKIYGELGNQQKKEEYLKKYNAKKNEVQTSQKKSLDYALKYIINEKEETYLSRQNVLLAITSVVSIIVLVLFFFYKKVQKRKKKALEQLIEKEETVQILEQKVNESFEDVVQLAKNNSPEFLTRFDEVYPEFSNRLKDVYPDIGSEELRFCALLKLNFSTKDIAKYTFVTVRAVQTRKSRLRKKLNIPSEEDIYLWMNKLG